MVVCGLQHVVTETVENSEFLKGFKNFIIIVSEQEIIESVAIDNERTYVYQEEILEEGNLFLKNSN